MSEDGASGQDDRFVPAFSDAWYGATLGSVAAGISAVGTTGIGALMLLIVADVIGRNFLDMPITGVAEIAARGVVAIVFLQVAAAILQKRLTRADFLMRRIGGVSPGAVSAMEAAFCLCGAVIFGLIVWSSWPKFVEAWASAEFFGVQGVWTIPTWPFRGITVFGAGIAVLAALYRFYDEIRGLRNIR